MCFGRRGLLAASPALLIAVFLASCGLFHKSSAPPGVGQEVIDGQLAFIVTGVGTSPMFGPTQARGVWLTVSMAVRNIGTDAEPFDMAAQKLKESDGRVHSASFMEPPSVNKIDPGLQLSVKLAFDVPPGVRPTQIMLHESASSSGEPVRLAQPPSTTSSHS